MHLTRLPRSLMSLHVLFRLLKLRAGKAFKRRVRTERFGACLSTFANAESETNPQHGNCVERLVQTLQQKIGTLPQSNCAFAHLRLVAPLTLTSSIGLRWVGASACHIAKSQKIPRTVLSVHSHPSIPQVSSNCDLLV